MRTIIIRIFYTIAILCGGLSFLLVIDSVLGLGTNAMQQTGQLTLALAIAIIPYVISREIEKLLGWSDAGRY